MTCIRPGSLFETQRCDSGWESVEMIQGLCQEPSSHETEIIPSQCPPPNSDTVQTLAAPAPPHASSFSSSQFHSPRSPSRSSPSLTLDTHREESMNDISLDRAQGFVFDDHKNLLLFV